MWWVDSGMMQRGHMPLPGPCYFATSAAVGRRGEAVPKQLPHKYLGFKGKRGFPQGGRPRQCRPSIKGPIGGLNREDPRRRQVP
jgi:hypothetical protein